MARHLVITVVAVSRAVRTTCPERGIRPHLWRNAPSSKTTLANRKCGGLISPLLIARTFLASRTIHSYLLCETAHRQPLFPNQTMRSTIALFAVTVAMGGSAPVRTAKAQSSTSAVARPTEAAARAQTSPAAYLGEPSAFVAGKTVYLRSTKTRIGTIEAIDANHHFPLSFPRRYMSAVLIHRRDGPRDWMPLAGITRIYVVGK